MGRPGYEAGVTALDDELVETVFERLKPEQYLTLGLAVWYLHSSPVRHRNQCLTASIVVAECARRFGARAELLGAAIDIPWAKNGHGVRYGGAPVIERGQVKGHVVAMIEDRFLDTTASQYPEIRDNQNGLPIVGSLGPYAPMTLDQATTVRTRIGNPPHDVDYHLTPPSTLRAVETHAKNTDGTGLLQLVNNTLVGYTLAIAERARLGLLDLDDLPGRLQ